MLSPQGIAERAKEIYEGLDSATKARHSGEFVVIDVQGGGHYFSPFSARALQTARKKAPNGIFHLIRVGFPTAFKVSQSGGHEQTWTWPL